MFILAFLSGCAIDLIVSTVREAVAHRVAPQVQLRVAIQVWMLDACVAPLGLLLALGARHDHPPPS